MTILSNQISDAEKRSLALVELLKLLSVSKYRFVTVTPVTHALVNAKNENKAANNLEYVFGWNRKFNPEIFDINIINLMIKAGILDSGENFSRSALRISSIEDRLYYHSSFPTLEKESVFFGPDTYRFINLIEQSLNFDYLKNHRIVDICTGAGPAAIEIALKFPNSKVYGVDINKEALKLAKINALAAGSKNVTFLMSDLLNDIDGTFDLIVANPPYLSDSLGRSYRDGGGSLGEKLSEDIVKVSLERLNIGGKLILYTGVVIQNGFDHFLNRINNIINKNLFYFKYKEIDPDVFSEELLKPAYANTDRIAVVSLEITRLPIGI